MNNFLDISELVWFIIVVSRFIIKKKKKMMLAREASVKAISVIAFQSVCCFSVFNFKKPFFYYNVSKA